MESPNRKDWFMWAREITPHLDTAEARFHQILSEADVSADVGRAVREALVWFYRATETLNRMLADLDSRPRLEVVVDIAYDWPPAEEDLQASAELLTKAIDPALDDVAKKLAEKWEKDKPFGALARAPANEELAGGPEGQTEK